MCLGPFDFLGFESNDRTILREFTDFCFIFLATSVTVHILTILLQVFIIPVLSQFCITLIKFLQKTTFRGRIGYFGSWFQRFQFVVGFLEPETKPKFIAGSKSGNLITSWQLGRGRERMNNEQLQRKRKRVVTKCPFLMGAL